MRRICILKGTLREQNISRGRFRIRIRTSYERESFDHDGTSGRIISFLTFPPSAMPPGSHFLSLTHCQPNDASKQCTSDVITIDVVVWFRTTSMCRLPRPAMWCTCVQPTATTKPTFVLIFSQHTLSFICTCFSFSQCQCGITCVFSTSRLRVAR